MSSLRAVRTTVAVATACALLALPAVAQSSKAAAGAAAPRTGDEATRPARAPGSEGIAAVVNDEVVSVSDVNARIRMALLNAGAAANPETAQRLMPQVMRLLIDERLQMQEAKRQGVTVSASEIDDAVKRIAEQNRMNGQQLQDMLKRQNVPFSTLKDQIRALLAWQKVMQRRIRQEVVVGEDEVDAAMERLKANIGKPEYLVAEIFLAVDSPDQDDEVRRNAERLVEEVKRGGNFAALARQFSQSAGAASGGDLGWVRSGELSPEVDKALSGMRGGQLSMPVRTATGYHILLVRGQRPFGSSGGEVPMPAAQPVAPRPQPRPDLAKATVNMKQIILPIESKEQAKAVKEQAEKLRKSIKSCGDFQARAKESGMPESGDMGTMRVKDMAPGLQNLALGIPLGQASPVLMSPAAAVILIVCKRDVPMIQPPPEAQPAPPPPPAPTPIKEAKLPGRDEIERELVNERSELLSRRYLRDLRRTAFIETRL
ncbi:peptidyl-prolyl cis-trans isomerase SurA [Azospirillum lipoferum]|uniref:Parvulin-like PPIase n=1 Tax=Azospirillum lipoferum TaxID=193 RepID=A0A5A9GS47_AZOLI|nr:MULTISPECIES: peptidylprolyl isomerase [Azospirillum]KAA0597301.1 peptidylprolyl isomerase [Azospirillum lipoferum]MCP1608825.1 peptidyl-prolyl cis-trans isomerase SurA [Azospirillum lipoferum]MDW5535860.1 peptidylprolyl isomerase [Azospirillum sp. NL1]